MDFDEYWERRRSYTKNSPLVRSVRMVPSPQRPHVFDATGGLARDAFVLACFGYRLTVAERHPVIFALLRDAVRRARHPEVRELLGHMTFLRGDSARILPVVEPAPDVVYLDPMFTWPKGSRRALPKKEMQISRRVVGADRDWAQVLGAALACAQRRVVLKQPLIAPVRPRLRRLCGRLVLTASNSGRPTPWARCAPASTAGPSSTPARPAWPPASACSRRARRPPAPARARTRPPPPAGGGRPAAGAAGPDAAGAEVFAETGAGDGEEEVAEGEEAEEDLGLAPEELGEPERPPNGRR